MYIYFGEQSSPPCIGILSREFILPNFTHARHKIPLLDGFAQFAGYPGTFEFTLFGTIVSTRCLQKNVS